ncbi:MAG: alkaline phosphatase family protein [Candidatus Omnitrophica bacterium]|nr:alkaline phosphatase family protein [Candidatus Omnitrophota bacterium]
MFLAYIDPGTGFVVATGGGLLIAFIIFFFATFLLFFKKIFKFFKDNKKNTVILLLIIVIAVIILIGVFMNKNTSDFDKRIIILGLDGLSPDIIENLIEQGKLPHFAQLKQKGYYRHLSTTNPSQSPIAWSGFATGQNPGKHGLFDFIKRNPKDYMLEIAQTNIKGSKVKPVRTTKSFWHYTSQKKIPTVVIACPVTFPPDEIYGRMLSGMGVPDILGTQGTFTFYTTEHLKKDKDIGGKVFEIIKKPMMRLKLIGPKTSSSKETNTTIPFVVQLKENSILIDVQNNHIELKEKQWSDWVSVEFKIGLFKKIKGILRFYLVEKSPEFKLYISPINFDPRAPFFQISHPKGYSNELAREIGLYYTQGMPMDTWAVNEKRLSEEPFLELINDVYREKKAMLDYEMNKLEKGVLFCYFEDPDIIQHMFWRYRDPKHPLYEKDAPQEYKDMIDNWYQKMDALVGDVMQKMNQDDILIILSDHGFNTFRRAVHINSWLRENGYQKLKNPYSKVGRELFEDVDWRQTKAYAIGFGAIYINQIGRESQGIVKPGQETEELKKEISEKIKQLRDDKYNSLVVNSVYTKEDIFWGPYSNQAPDLYLGFNIGYRASWQTAIGGAPEELIEDNLKKWSGSHLFDPKLIPGILFTNFKIDKKNPSIYDIVPTILKICGYSDEELKEMDLDGSPLN